MAHGSQVLVAPQDFFLFFRPSWALKIFFWPGRALWTGLGPGNDKFFLYGCGCCYAGRAMGTSGGVGRGPPAGCRGLLPPQKFFFWLQGSLAPGARRPRGLSWAAAPEFFSSLRTGPGPGLGVWGRGAPGASQGGPPLEVFFVWGGPGCAGGWAGG